jgi:4-hydroxy-3-polyprenylbenzoate decarboxylase
MAFKDLRDFIAALEKAGELKRIPFEVDPVLEITEFADRSVKTGGPALLFEKPKGSDVPVLINAFASDKRMQIALEVDSIEEIANRITGFLQMQPAEGLMGKLKMLPVLAEVGAFSPRSFRAAHAKR